MGAEIILPNGAVRNLADDSDPGPLHVLPTPDEQVLLEDAPPSMLRELVESGGLPFVKVIVNPETGDMAVLSAGLGPEDLNAVFTALASVDAADVAAGAVAV